MPTLLLPKSIATPELVAHTITSKYCDHLPLYRQEAIWKRMEIDLPRSSLSGWVLKAADLCAPLIKLLQRQIIKNDYVQADETTVQVLDEIGRRNDTKSYMWCYRGGGERPSIVYEYQASRGGYHAQTFLQGFKGYLQSDAYPGYNWAKANDQIITVGCHAHARRPFAELVKLNKGAKLAGEALNFYRQLYKIEKQARESSLSSEARYHLRLKKALPVLDAFKLWLDHHLAKTSEHGKIGKAIRYFIKHWESLKNGTYEPRPLKRLYFKDEVVDQLYLADRILQNVLLKQIKSTFNYIINPKCFHLHGPSGVKYATNHVKQALDSGDYPHVIRADIKSFYKSISHHKLIQDIKSYYNDPKLIAVLKNIITNPIETPNGSQNPMTGVALRGPLSQFFSALYLKPLDDAFNNMDVVYARFQDDIVLFCKTKRQLNRCRQKMMNMLHERRLTLSRKKSRIGLTKDGFHFLGVDYLPTRMEDNTASQYVNDESISIQTPDPKMNRGGRQYINYQKHQTLQMVPHARTLRKAREQVKAMVA